MLAAAATESDASATALGGASTRAAPAFAADPPDVRAGKFAAKAAKIILDVKIGMRKTDMDALCRNAIATNHE